MNFNLKTHTTGKVYDLTQENMNALISGIEQLRQTIIDLYTELAKEYATQLYDGIWEDAVMWLQTPNEDFLNQSPQLLILNGQGHIVVDYLKVELSLNKGV